MKAHSLRSVLWFGNVALAAGAVGVAVWYFTDVKPAVASVTGRKGSPAWSQKAVLDYQGMDVVIQPIDVAVKEKEITAVILKPEFEKANRLYWVFSGPLPPPEVPDAPVEVAGPPQPEGLDAIGDPVSIIYNPPVSVVVFKLKSGVLEQFVPGDYVKEKSGPDRFKLVNVLPVEGNRDQKRIVYEVYDAGKKEPVRTAEMLFDGSLPAPGPGAPITFSKPPGAGPGPAEAPGGPGAPPAGIVGASTTPAPAADGPSWRDAKPTIEERDARNTYITFDQTLFDSLRNKDADALAKTVKTQVHKDPKTGQVVGLMITGFGDDSPAQKFDVKPGDILISINGRPVRDRSEAINIAQGLPKDTRNVDVVIERNGKQRTYHIDPSDPKTRRSARYLDNR
jgi:hypothetical protein